MKNAWNVMALKLGVSTIEKSLFTCAEGIGKKITVPIWSIAIYNDTHKILVDTGYHDVDWVTKNCEISEQKEAEKIQNAIYEGLKWELDDVDIIINTHLHYDHCGNNSLFSNAEFYVSKTEWEFAFNPLQSQKRIYLENLFSYESVNYFNWNFVEGEMTILPGILVFPTPGHTPGHQSVLVNTKEGPLCIAGDATYLTQNIRDNLIPQISYSNKDLFDTYVELRKRANHIIPGHEYNINNFQTNDFPAIK